MMKTNNNCVFTYDDVDWGDPDCFENAVNYYLRDYNIRNCIK